MPVEFDDRGLRVYGHNVKGLQFYDWDRVLRQEIYLQEDNTLNICGDVIDGGVGALITAGAWLGDDGGGEFRFQADAPAVVRPGGIVTEYATIVAAIAAADSGDSVVIPPGTYDEAVTLKDGVKVVELMRGTVVIHSTSAEVAVTAAAGGYINVKEIQATGGVGDDPVAVEAAHSSGVCIVVAELIRAENSTGASGGDTFAIYQHGAGTLWVFAERIEAVGAYFDVYGANCTTGTQYVAAKRIFVQGTDEATVRVLYGLDGMQYVWGELRGEGDYDVTVAYGGGGYADSVQYVWGNCTAIVDGTEYVASWAVAALEDGGFQEIHGNCYAECNYIAVGASLTGGTQRIFGDVSAIAVQGNGTSRAAWATQATDDGYQEIWGNAIATGGSTSEGAFLDDTASSGVVEQRVDGDVSGDDYGARCETETQTITGGRASGGTYDLYQTGGVLEIASVQYGTYSGTITLLTESINALIVELEDTTELTIAAGVVTVTQSYHRIDTQDDDPSDDLVTINGGVTGRLLVIRPEDGGRTVVVKHNTGNIWILAQADVTLDEPNDHLMLVYDGSMWSSL